ncbi:MAG: hypothetical protein EZS28_041161 [Streblomastix strix]|uniref:Uncharacterized protein n=1 Tax=Streblomastix strix TaxID=222440 RepID=A0A5J4TZV1_9EUKA|nr:MAG: hypothetical protein EZS28_041161 [Streblomastix strix]
MNGKTQFEEEEDDKEEEEEELQSYVSLVYFNRGSPSKHWSQSSIQSRDSSLDGLQHFEEHGLGHLSVNGLGRSLDDYLSQYPTSESPAVSLNSQQSQQSDMTDSLSLLEGFTVIPKKNTFVSLNGNSEILLGLVLDLYSISQVHLFQLGQNSLQLLTDNPALSWIII